MELPTDPDYQVIDGLERSLVGKSDGKFQTFEDVQFEVLIILLDEPQS